jgi:threonine/homoserine/homoserine lactone efflux protein
MVVASPGTRVLYTMAAGLSRGARASVIAAVGCTIGIVPHMVAAITGLAALLHTSAVAFQTLKYLFFFAFLPQFVSARDPNAFVRMVQLSSIFMLMTLVIFVACGIFAAVIRKHVISRPQVLTWMCRVFAGAFAALGARLAFADR